MAIIGLNILATEKYVSDTDPDKGTTEATVWDLGTLDSLLMARIQDKATSYSTATGGENSSASVQISVNESALETVRFGLKGWKNFKDVAGNEIEYRSVATFVSGKKYNAVPTELVALIPLPLIQELNTRIRDLNSVSDATRGNSDAA